MEKEIIKYSHIHGISFTQEQIPGVFPQHWHNDAEFILVLKKGCKYRIDGEIFEGDVGDVILVWPCELHEVLHNPSDGIVFIQFSSYLIESNSDFAAASHFLHKCHIIRKENSPELAEKIGELIFKIRDIYDQNLYFSETRCKILVYEILLLAAEFAMKEHRQSLGDERFSDRAWEYVRFACGYISAHSSENITQAEVAEKTGLSQYYFSKLFNEYTKMSFPSYLAKIRIQNVINLLANTNRSITSCALESGFQSTTTFNKLFVEHTGCSPREYRNLLKKNR